MLDSPNFPFPLTKTAHDDVESGWIAILSAILGGLFEGMYFNGLPYGLISGLILGILFLFLVIPIGSPGQEDDNLAKGAAELPSRCLATPFLPGSVYLFLLLDWCSFTQMQYTSRCVIGSFIELAALIMVGSLDHLDLYTYHSLFY